ncbi:TonB family protein [Inhella proteolytica]|nr:TonB family protein [Inhella proteolytica]
MFLRTSIRATTLVSLLSLSLGVLAQSGDAGLSDQERAKRDAGKVFNFIKFHAVRAAKPADKPAEKPADKPVETRAAVAAAPVARRASDAQVATLDAARAAEPAPAQGLGAPTHQAAAPAATAAQSATLASPIAQSEPNPLAAPAQGAGAAVLPVAALVTTPNQPAPSVTPPPAEPEPEEEVALQLLEYVEPELPRANNVNTVTGGKVTVRFEVGTDGKVVSAVPREGAPRRLAQAAARAVQQWRFAPLNAAREAEVDIVFKLD